MDDESTRKRLVIDEIPATLMEPLLACCSGSNSSGFAASGFLADVSSFACA